MPVVAGALVSLLVAWFRGASPLTLGDLRLRWLPLPLVSFGVQLVVFSSLIPDVGPLTVPLHLGSMILLLAFLLVNLRYRALGIVALGTALNLLVIALNGGHMPARPAHVRAIGFPQVADALETAGYFQKTGRMYETTRLPMLGDVVHLPLPGPGPDRLVSPGDLLIAAGVFLFVQEAPVPRHRRSQERPRQGESTIGRWKPDAPRHQTPPPDPGWIPERPTSTSPSAAPSASTATSIPTPAKSV